MKSKYQCRRCGEYYVDGCTGNKDIALMAVVEMCVQGHSNRLQAPTLYKPHICDDGGIGLSDFIGWDNEAQVKDK